MTKHIKAVDTATNNGDPSNCWTWLAILQLVLGVLLVTAAAFAYSLMNHPAMLIPCLMGVAVLFQGARAFLMCRNRPLMHDHHHPSTG